MRYRDATDLSLSVVRASQRVTLSWNQATGKAQITPRCQSQFASSSRNLQYHSNSVAGGSRTHLYTEEARRDWRVL